MKGKGGAEIESVLSGLRTLERSGSSRYPFCIVPTIHSLIASVYGEPLWVEGCWKDWIGTGAGQELKLYFLPGFIFLLPTISRTQRYANVLAEEWKSRSVKCEPVFMVLEMSFNGTLFG